jgi:hypothetical protein
MMISFSTATLQKLSRISKEGLLSRCTYSLAHFARLLARADNSVRTASRVIISRATTNLAHRVYRLYPILLCCVFNYINIESRGASTSPTLIERNQNQDEGNGNQWYIMLPFGWCVPYSFDVFYGSEGQPRETD